MEAAAECDGSTCRRLQPARRQQRCRVVSTGGMDGASARADEGAESQEGLAVWRAQGLGICGRAANRGAAALAPEATRQEGLMGFAMGQAAHTAGGLEGWLFCIIAMPPLACRPSLDRQ